MIKIRLSKIFIIIILIPFILGAFFPDDMPTIRLGVFSVYLMDILAIFLILSVIIRLIITRFRIKRQVLLPLILGILLLLSFIRGVHLFGIEQATNSLRNYLYFYAVFLATIVLIKNTDLIIQVIFIWGVVAWVLFGLVIIRWGLVIIGVSENSTWLSAGGLMTRVVNASQTLFILQSILFSVSIKKKTSIMPFQKLIPFLFIPAIVLLQHRTIWVVFIITIFYLFVLRKKIKSYYIGVFLLAFVIFGIFLLLFSDSSFMKALMASVQNLETFTWRVEGWRGLLSSERFSSVMDYFIGQPFGTGYTRMVTNSVGKQYRVDYSPHNFYIETFLNIGGLGLITLIMIYLRIFIGFRKKIDKNFSLSFLLIILSQLIYYLTYGPSYEQGLLLGTALLLMDSND